MVYHPKMGSLQELKPKAKKQESKSLVSKVASKVLPKTQASQNDEEEEIASVVVTFSVHGGSYDELFKKAPQESELGRVVVFSGTVGDGTILRKILRTLQGENTDQIEDTNAEEAEALKKLYKYCDAAGHDAVCFNFECCAGYSSQGFGATQNHLELIAYLVKEYGCLTMFSDFSLKALIRDWDEALLGPNPLSQVGEFDGHLKLNFDPEKLKSSVSAQLETIGELCNDGNGKGTATCEAISGTIAYTVTNVAADVIELCRCDESELSAEDKARKSALPYELDVLTVAESLGYATQQLIKNVDANQNQSLVSVEGTRGLAGHIAITYPPSASSIAIAAKNNEEIELEEEKENPNRGVILTSCGHWIELMKIDSSVDRLLNAYADEYGEESETYQDMKQNLLSVSGMEQEQRMMKASNMYVQSRSPAKYNQKLVRKKKNGI